MVWISCWAVCVLNFHFLDNNKFLFNLYFPCVHTVLLYWKFLFPFYSSVCLSFSVRWSISWNCWVVLDWFSNCEESWSISLPHQLLLYFWKIISKLQIPFHYCWLCLKFSFWHAISHMKPATLWSVNCEVIDALEGQTTLSSTLDKVGLLMKPNLFLHCLKAGWVGQDLMCLKMSQRFLNNCLGLKM